MSDKPQDSAQPPADAAALRKRAEAQARAMDLTAHPAQPPEEIQQMLHELRVHQIELEMQNEELRTAQAEIEAVRARYFDLYNLAPVGYCTLYEKGLILEANLTAASLLGTARSALVKQPISRFILKEDQDIYYRHHKKLLATGEAQECDLRLVRPDGAFFWAHSMATAAQAKNGAPVVRMAFSDISLRKATEAMLSQARDEAERANAAKNEFLSRMSHELRTPLNAILGFTQVLQLPGSESLSEQQVDNVREIHHAGEHLLGLVNEVLDLSRIESGRLEINPEPVALQPTIERCAAQIDAMARERGIRLTLHAHEPCTVLADPLRLQQALLNLLSNAVKYNREGGRIEVECAPAAQQRVRVSVRDSGRGLSAEQQARLFRPFERLESAYEGIEGTGIGLAIAKQLVEGMQGSIGVDSVPGEGSRFWFELPRCEAAVGNDRETPVSTSIVTPATQGQSQTILYIEDNPANLRLVRKILDKRADIELLSAENAEDGLQLAGREHPDLILLDINLPGMDGFEALQRLRADPATRAIPVIAVSANAMKRDIERGMAAGFQDYLVKPINVRDLFATIDTHLAAPKETP